MAETYDVANQFGENAYAGRLVANNVGDTGYSIVRASQIGGHRRVATKAALYNITKPILSESTSGNDAVGQLWYVEDESCFYQLVSWTNRKTSNGWIKFLNTATEAEIYDICGYENT